MPIRCPLPAPSGQCARSRPTWGSTPFVWTAGHSPLAAALLTPLAAVPSNKSFHACFSEEDCTGLPPMHPRPPPHGQHGAGGGGRGAQASPLHQAPPPHHKPRRDLSRQLPPRGDGTAWVPQTQTHHISNFSPPKSSTRVKILSLAGFKDMAMACNDGSCAGWGALPPNWRWWVGNGEGAQAGEGKQWMDGVPRRPFKQPPKHR